jgi:hypothetical protein
MSVAIDTDALAREKTEFDAEFDTTTEFDAEFDTTDEEQTADDEPICDLSCGTAFTI